jgi:hypothetical protein
VTTKPEFLQELIEKEDLRRKADEAALVAPYQEWIERLTAALQAAHDRMDDWNAEWGTPLDLCAFCVAMEYDAAVGIVHEPTCIILTMRLALAETTEGR